MLFLVFFTMDRKTWSVVSRMHPLFLVIALLLVVGKWVMLTLRSNILVHASGADLSYGKVVKSVLGGSFVGSVTPFRAAGIPTEIYFLYEYGLPGPQASAVVLSGAAVSILIFTLSLPFIFVLSASKIHVGLGLRTLLVTAGILAFLVFLFIAYSMKSPEKLARAIESAAPSCLKKKKSFDRFVTSFFNAIGDFSRSLRTIVGSNWRVLGAVFGLTAAAWFAEFLVAPVILWGLGYPQLFWKAAIAQMVVTSLLPFVPVPGAAGAAEATFATVFAVFVPASLVGFVTVAWRFFMFYLVLLGLGVGFILAVRDTGSYKTAQEIRRRRKEAPAADTET